MVEESGGTIAYISSAGTREILLFRLDSRTGSLQPLTRTQVPGPEGPSPTSMPMALSPDRRRLYVAVRSAPYPVSSFSVDARTGALELLGTAALADSMAYIATDRSGRYLFAASYVGAKVTVNPIGPQGEVAVPALQILATPPHAHAVLPDATNRWVFATSLGGDVVLQHSFDAATGRLLPNTPDRVRTKPGAGPRHIAFHPVDAFLYLLNELDASINCYALDRDGGTLEERQSIPMLLSDPQHRLSAADVHVTPDGRFLYGSERTTHQIVGFAVDGATGWLTPVGTFATEPSPRGFRIAPGGHFLLVAGQKNNRIAVHAVDGHDGRLTHVFDTPAGSNPNWIEVIDLPLSRNRPESGR
jgi:6-phosphogluconolactonase